MIALDYIPNYDFVTCQAWIEWINRQEIVLGQPCVKEDKRTRLMPLESRVKCTCLAQPANKRFNPDIRRLYLPRSAEQFMEFIRTLNITVYLVANNVGFQLEIKEVAFLEQDKDIMKIFGKLIATLKKAGKIK